MPSNQQTPEISNDTKQAVISELIKTAAGRQRVHYRLTARGRRRLGEVSENWRRINEAVQRVLAGDADALTG